MKYSFMKKFNLWIFEMKWCNAKHDKNTHITFNLNVKFASRILFPSSISTIESKFTNKIKGNETYVDTLILSFNYYSTINFRILSYKYDILSSYSIFYGKMKDKLKNDKVTTCGSKLLSIVNNSSRKLCDEFHDRVVDLKY